MTLLHDSPPDREALLPEPFPLMISSGAKVVVDNPLNYLTLKKVLALPLRPPRLPCLPEEGAATV